MGKRELVLIGAFIALGAVLYQATAPATPGARGFSLRGMMDSLRRGLASHREYAANEQRESLPIDPSVAELRIAGTSQVRLEGIDGDVAELVFQVFSTGADEAEALDLARRTQLRKQPSGDIIALEFTYPREGRQRTMLTVRLPRHLRARVSRTRSLEARDLGGLELDGTRGEVTVTRLNGVLRGSHSGGQVRAEKIVEVDLILRQTETVLGEVTGSTRINVTGGRVEADDLRGRIDLVATRADVELERASGELFAELSQGSLGVVALSGPARVDARGSELRFDLVRAVPVTALTSDDSISVRLPADTGFTIDATVDDGEIRLSWPEPQVTTSDRTRQARGPLHGGGPALALRTTRGDIDVR